LFRSNQRAFYRHLCSTSDAATGKPLLSDLIAFWKNIFEKESNANLQVQE